MGRIADALRDNLRQLAHSDARSLRALDEGLRAATGQDASQPVARLQEDLDGLTVRELKARCRAAGLPRYSHLRKGELVALLRSSSEARAAAVGAPRAGSTPGVEERLWRLERLLQLVAERVGVPSDQITAALGP